MPDLPILDIVLVLSQADEGKMSLRRRRKRQTYGHGRQSPDVAMCVCEMPYWQGWKKRWENLAVPIEVRGKGDGCICIETWVTV